MSFQMHMNEFEELFYKDKKDSRLIDEKRKISNEFGTGYISAKSFDNMLFAGQYSQFFKDLSVCDINSQAQEAYCFIMFTLEGQNSFKVNNQKKSYQFSKNRAYLGVSQEREKYQMDIKKDKTWQYSFNFSKDTLIEHLIGLNDLELINRIENTEQFNLLKQINLSLSHHHLIKRMINNPYHGTLKKLYFETCVNDLMITLLTDLSTKKVYDLTLNEGDRFRLEKAKNILLEDIQNPPTIAELSKKVALNQDKLKKGFKIIFDKTIYNTLIDERMKTAYAKLKKDDLSISEIAYEVGYENVSNFITVFKKQYGKTPGQMRKEKSFYWFE